MTNLSAGTRKLCVAYDVVGYSRFSARSQASTQSRLAYFLDRAFEEALLPGRKYEIQERGDGGVALLNLDPGTDELHLITSLVRTLETGLTQLNDDLVPAAQIRLRVSMAKGIINRTAHGFVGPVIIEACRLLDSVPLRRAMTETRSCLAVAFTDALYREMQSHLPDHLEFERTEFSLKSFTGIAWIYLASDSVRPSGLLDHLVTGAEEFSHSHMGHAEDAEPHATDDQVAGGHVAHEDQPHADTHDAHHSDPDIW